MMRDARRQFDKVGALHLPGAARPILAELEKALARWPDGQSGIRITGDDRIGRLLGSKSRMGGQVSLLVGRPMFPVRILYFDKNSKNNWALGWHQDRTVAVNHRVPVPGFAPWTRKQGILHVQPPFHVIEGLRTIRIHLDPVPINNGPLLVAAGSHRLGLVKADRCREVAESGSVLTCLAQSGDVWAYHTSILHASDRSSSGMRRRVVQVDYAADPLPHGLEWLGI